MVTLWKGRIHRHTCSPTKPVLAWQPGNAQRVAVSMIILLEHEFGQGNTWFHVLEIDTHGQEMVYSVSVSPHQAPGASGRAFTDFTVVSDCVLNS